MYKIFTFLPIYMILLENSFCQDDENDDLLCLKITHQIVYIDKAIQRFKTSSEKTESSEAFQKLSQSWDRSVDVTTGVDIGFKEFSIGKTMTVANSWSSANSQESSRKRFFSLKESEEIEYMPNTRQLFKETKVKFELERRLRGKTVKSSIAQYEETKYAGFIDTKVCESEDKNALIALATNDLRGEQKDHASDVKITGPHKNRMEETKCGKSREYSISLELKSTPLTQINYMKVCINNSLICRI